MIINKARLIELLYHEKENVRDDCAHALTSFFKKSNGVIHHLLESAMKYSKNNVSLVATIKYFVPDDDEFQNVLKYLHHMNNTEKQTDLDINNLYNLKTTLMEFPFEILNRNKNCFQFSSELLKDYEIASNREKVKNQSPDKLWNQMVELCKKYKGGMAEKDDRAYGQLLLEGLLKHRDYTRRKVTIYLGNYDIGNYQMEQYLVKLSGKLKIDEAVPYLFKIFNSSDFMEYIYSDCLTALGEIGSKEVVEEIEKLYQPDNKNRGALAGTLGKIPFEYSENLAI